MRATKKNYGPHRKIDRHSDWRARAGGVDFGVRQDIKNPSLISIELPMSSQEVQAGTTTVPFAPLLEHETTKSQNIQNIDVEFALVRGEYRDRVGRPEKVLEYRRAVTVPTKPFQ